MTIRLLCVSTADNTDQILNSLVEGSDDIELRLHFGNDMADFKASSLSRMDTRKGQRGHLMREQYYAGENYELLASPISEKVWSVLLISFSDILMATVIARII